MDLVHNHELRKICPTSRCTGAGHNDLFCFANATTAGPVISDVGQIHMIQELSSEKLKYSSPKICHDTELYPIFSDQLAMKYFGPERILSLKETQQWIKNHEDLKLTEGFAPWIVSLKTNGKIIGWGGLTRNSHDEQPYNELIYIISKEYWGMGFGYELAKFSIQYGFNSLNLKTIDTNVRSQNSRSINIIKKLGMNFIHIDDTGRDWYKIFK